VAEAEAAGTAEVVLRTGNPDSARDFTDVRDVVRAYRAAAELPAGVYNLCSGRATSVRHLVELVRRATSLPVRHEIDPDRLRAHDVPELRGSAERLRAASGWRPEIPLERTVADALEVWRRRTGWVRGEGKSHRIVLPQSLHITRGLRIASSGVSGRRSTLPASGSGGLVEDLSHLHTSPRGARGSPLIPRPHRSQRAAAATARPAAAEQATWAATSSSDP
jgi:hypothetical protein